MEISGRNWHVLVGDVIDGLRLLPDNSVQCCVTSPPYWGLRDYGVDGQIGLEPTPEAFTAKMVEVFSEVHRVLRPDGTCWVNIGDSYATGAGKANNPGSDASRMEHMGKLGYVTSYPSQQPNRMKLPGLKPKDLVGIPWRLAFALQAAGWWLRSEIIWHKRSPMPESVTDRPTKAHEQIFLFTKSESYFFDQEAVKEEAVSGNCGSKFTTGKTAASQANCSKNERVDSETRNIRTVWTLSSESFPGAHFATFPSTIPMRAIKAGTSEKGCCPQCGAPWERTIEKERVATRPGLDSKVNRASDDPDSPYERHSGMVVGNRDPQRHVTKSKTTGWQPTCDCGLEVTEPCVVLDPFSGSGTTGMVATELGRVYVGCELNPEYAEMSRTRIESWKKRDAKKTLAPLVGQRDLFSGND